MSPETKNKRIALLERILELEKDNLTRMCRGTDAPTDINKQEIAVKRVELEILDERNS